MRQLFRLQQGSRFNSFSQKTCTKCKFFVKTIKKYHCGGTRLIYTSYAVDTESGAHLDERPDAPPAGRRILCLFTKHWHNMHHVREQAWALPSCRRRTFLLGEPLRTSCDLTGGTRSVPTQASAGTTGPLRRRPGGRFSSCSQNIGTSCQCFVNKRKKYHAAAGEAGRCACMCLICTTTAYVV
jgi:hypothetical protein